MAATESTSNALAHPTDAATQCELLLIDAAPGPGETPVGERAGASWTEHVGQWQFAFLTLLTHLCVVGQMLVLMVNLGSERYAALAFALVLQSYLFLFSSAGIRAVTVRDAVLRPRTFNQTATAYLILTSTVSAGFGLIVAAASVFARFTTEEQILLLLLIAGNIIYSMNLQPLFDSQHQLIRSGAVTLAIELLALAVLGALCYQGPIRLPTAGVVFLCKWILNLTTHFLVFHFGIRRLEIDINLTQTCATLHSAWPLMFSAFLTTIPFNAGVFFQWSRGELHDVTLLALAQQSASGFLVMSAAGIRVVQANFARATKAGEGLQRIATVFVSLTITLFVGSLGFALLLVWFVLGATFQDAVLPIALMLIAGLISSFGALANSYLVLRRVEIGPLASNGIACLFYIVMSCVAFPHLTPTVAAAITCGAAFLATMVAVMCAIRYMPEDRTILLDSAPTPP